MPSLPEFRAAFSLASHCPSSPGSDGHGGVRSLALSPDLQWLASGGDDGTVAIHSVQTLGDRAIAAVDPVVGKVIAVGREWVRAIAVAPSGDWWVAGSNDGSLRVFHWVDADQAWKPCQLIAHAHQFWVMAIEISPDGKTVISVGADHRVQAWRVERHEVDVAEMIALTPSWTGQHHRFWVSCVAIAPDGQTVFSAGYDGCVAVWEMATGKLLRHWQAHSGYIASLAIAPDGKTLATGGPDRLIHLWEPESGTERATCPGNGSNVFTLAFHPNGQTLYSGGGDGSIRAWDSSSGKFLHFVAGNVNCIWSMAIAPNGQWLAVGGVDGSVRWWSLADRRDLGFIATEAEQLPGLAVSPDSQTLWLGGNRGDIRAIALPPNPTALTFPAIHGHCDGRVRAIAFGDQTSEQSHDLWTAGDDGYIRHWHLTPQDSTPPTAPAPAADTQIKPVHAWHTDTLWTMAIAHSQDPNNPWIASGGTDQIITLWEPDGTPRLRLAGHTGWISALVIAPDRTWLISASHDGTLRQWNPDTGDCLRILTPPEKRLLETVAVDARGHWIASAGEGQVWLWNAHTGQLSATFHHSNRAITHVHFSPEARHLIATSLNHSIRWWNLETLACDREIFTQVPAIATQTLPKGHLITAPAWGGHLEFFASAPIASASQTTH